MSKANNYFEEREDEIESEFRRFLAAALPNVHPVSLDAVASHMRFMVERYRDGLFRQLNDLCKEKNDECKD